MPSPSASMSGRSTSYRSPFTRATVNGRNGARVLNARIVWVNVSRSIAGALLVADRPTDMIPHRRQANKTPPTSGDRGSQSAVAPPGQAQRLVRRPGSLSGPSRIHNLGWAGGVQSGRLAQGLRRLSREDIQEGWPGGVRVGNLK